MITIRHEILEEYCKLWSYNITDESVVLFGIRGFLPKMCINQNSNMGAIFMQEHSLIATKVNFRNPRCTIGIWDREKEKIALFPGSSVPSLEHMHSFPQSVKTYNILSPGCYKLFPGIHPRNTAGMQRHKAFLMEERGIISRPEVFFGKNFWKFNLSNQKFFVDYPGDNLHASRSEPLSSSTTGFQNILTCSFSSSGCMVVCGQPKEFVSKPLRKNMDVWNYWMVFQRWMEEYNLNYCQYKFLLIGGQDFEKIKIKSENRIFRYGSESSHIMDLQWSLSKIKEQKKWIPFYADAIDGAFIGATADSYFNYLIHMGIRTNYEIDIQDFNSAIKHFKIIKNPNYHVIN